MQGEEAGPTTAEVGRGGSRGGRHGTSGSGVSGGVGGERRGAAVRRGKREWGFGGKRGRMKQRE